MLERDGAAVELAHRAAEPEAARRSMASLGVRDGGYRCSADSA